MHDAIVKFDTYRNLQRHRVVLLAIALLLFLLPMYIMLAVQISQKVHLGY